MTFLSDRASRNRPSPRPCSPASSLCLQAEVVEAPSQHVQQLACTAKALLLEELVSEGFSVDCSDFHLQKLPEAVEAQSQRVQQLASTAMTFLSAGSSSRQAVAVPDGTGPESTPDRKISRGPEPRSPSQISMMQAEQIRIVPEELRQVPIFTNPAVGYTWGQAVGEAVSTYTVFDHLRHSRIARKLPQASLLEIAASAISEALCGCVDQSLGGPASGTASSSVSAA